MLRIEAMAMAVMLGVFASILVLAASIESPQYTVVHSESDFEIRHYRASAWMTSKQDDISFVSATQKGFHKLFQYIEGLNLNSSRVPMTAPVLTGIVPSAGPFCSSAFKVRFYIPAKFQSSPPIAIPESELEAEYWEDKCIAVRKFSGFARDDNVAKEASKLAISLSKTEWANSTFGEGHEDDDSYTIAQYNSPFKIIGRINEVWVLLKLSHECSLDGFSKTS